MIRKPAVSGYFYPAKARKLDRMISGFLTQIQSKHIESHIKGLIVPHAGYDYSGYVAAHSYRALLDQGGKGLKRIIMIGPAHTKHANELVSDKHDYWMTPFGTVKVYQDGFEVDSNAHKNEHCLEVQLPFLQKLFPNLEIIPLLFSEISNIESNAAKVVELLDDATLLLISTDLSHFYPYADAVKRDWNTINAINNLDLDRLIKGGDACAKAAVLVSLAIAKKLHWKVQHLCYKNSGDVGGNKSSVVGYASFVYTK